MSILQDLMSWDKKSFDTIEKIYYDYRESPLFIKDIISIVFDGTEEKGSTWLLKRYLENRGTLKEKDIEKVYNAIPSLRDWEARLHILQSIPYMPIQKESREVVESFIREGLTDKNKFVRAWSYNGLYELATQFPEYKEEVEDLLNAALQYEAPSAKARIRKILKKGF